MASDFSAEKRQLHQLVESLPPEKVGDLVLVSLLNAPPDDEPHTEDQRQRDAEAESVIGRGEGRTREEVLHEFGL